MTERPSAANVFTPEDFSPEQRMAAQTVRDFVAREVLPVSEQIEAQDFELLRRLLLWAGELGLLMTEVPEEFGGLALDKTAAALIYENLSGQASFQTLCGVHSSIGLLPLVYYGTPAQKRRWLPSLATGGLVGCYCLTEPTSGSDALAMRTNAVLTQDGRHYILNGSKQFITNGGMADLFTVFAKVDGERVTAFVLERDTPGLSVGREEHKMGLRGSSTTAVILQDAMVPVENVLGEVGQGHKIAFNILNLGRVKLGVHAVGNGKRALELALAYCREREQFGKPIIEFGAVREKLAHMYARTYVLEAATYRTLGQLDTFIAGHRDAGGASNDAAPVADVAASAVGGESCDTGGTSPEAAAGSPEVRGTSHDARGGTAFVAGGPAALAAGAAYRVECALVKVLGSETLDLVVDEALQCFGGYGFSAEYPIERFYRDSRINRIYEGTNEINRLFAASVLLNTANVGPPARDPGGAVSAGRARGPLAAELGLVDDLKATCLLVIEAIRQRQDAAPGATDGATDGATEDAAQPLLLRVADLALQAYRAESGLLRARKDAQRRGAEHAGAALAAARVVCEEAVQLSEGAAREILAALGGRAKNERLRGRLARLALRTPVDTMSLRETIAAALVRQQHRIV